MSKESGLGLPTVFAVQAGWSGLIITSTFSDSLKCSGLKDNLYKLSAREGAIQLNSLSSDALLGSCQFDGCLEPTDAKHKRYTLESSDLPRGRTHYSPRSPPWKCQAPSLWSSSHAFFLVTSPAPRRGSALLCVSSKQNTS